ncbi:DUF2357 domain-containing protein [Pyrococcus yayanosii]|uniref:DUF2357 domain-containing protein n=1 Tax=Pyrococcus yayanosii (strain CH1 / JCM 16557) TaxID=529709 RepID=F8AFD6_PYRYC|nr:DUF2357 domain-containing protein [Pyrococcus yayanosii]AEH23743.1 conserved hypothetical protein [Pyrococcus yayanosii CH1]
MEVPINGEDGYWLVGEDLITYEGRLYLFEWAEYWVVGERPFIVKAGGEEVVSRKIKENAYVAQFSFRNYVGRARVEVIEEKGRKIFRDVEVLSRKILQIYGIKKDEEDIKAIIEVHRRFYETIVNDIIKISSLLPFSVRAPTGFGVVESGEPMSELFAYHYLRSNKERILEAFETMLRHIKRKLVVEEDWLGLEDVSEVTSETFFSIVQYPEHLVSVGEGVLLSEYLRGHVPMRVLSFRKYESVDTPENRFVKYFLNLLVEWSERVIGVFGDRAEVNAIEELLREFEFIRSNGVWEEIGEMKFFPYTSQALLKGVGYRDLLELYREFTAYSPFFEELQGAIDNKDIAKLYEYWAFFRLVEELGEILGSKELKIVITPGGELPESGDVYAEFDNGWRLYYNKELVPKRWSYSVTMRPDFSLFDGDPDRAGTRLIGVFDAKFKLDVVDEPKEMESFDEEVEALEREWNYWTWAKLEDIYKMHTYRDALGCRFAVVVYPGDVSVFFKTRGRKLTDFDLATLILLDDFEGVGYLKLRPEVVENDGFG